MNEGYIRKVLSLLQVSYWEKGNRLAICCPFHDDHDPSAAFYLDTGYFHCFGEDQTHTDLTGFYAKVRGCNRAQAERDLEKTLGLSPLPPREIDSRLLDKTARAGEKILKDLRHLSRKEHALKGETLDRILLAYERGQLDEVKLHQLFDRWRGKKEEQLEEAKDLD